MRHIRFWQFCIVAWLAFGLVGVWVNQTLQAQEQNLLTNPGFEGPYGPYVPSFVHPDCPSGTCGTAQTAAGWTPWWQTVAFLDPAIYGNPEYKPAEAKDFASRVMSGERAQQYFNFGRTSTAGVYQQVSVPANSQVRFTVWGQAWSTGRDWEGPYSDVTYSAEPTPVNMRVGIDPTGGVDPFSPNIVWSGTAHPYDQYALFSVEAQATGSVVTVFTYSSPNEPRKHNDIYWDEASLVVVGAGFAPPPVAAPAGEGDAAAAPAAVSLGIPPTATPNAEGVIYSVVGPGDSLWSMAAKAGISLQQILEYNGLGENAFVHEGQLLVTGYGTPAAAETPEPTPTPAEVATLGGNSAPVDDAASAPAPSPTPEVVVVQGGDICLTAYDDDNQNGVRDAGETLMAAVAFTISDGQAVVSNYITDGQSEPYCIRGLDAGSYRITRSRLAQETLTTAGEVAASLTDGAALNLEFGSVVGAAPAADAAAGELAAAPDAAAAPEVAPAETTGAVMDGEGASNGILIAVVVAAVLLLIAVLIIILSRRTA